jgi:hypothetical protein
MVVTPFAVYCVVWVFSAIFAGISTLTLTAIDHLGNSKFESNAALRPRPAGIAAFYGVATVAASAADQVANAEHSRAASLRKRRSACTVGVSRVAARGDACRTLLASVNTNATKAAAASGADHLCKGVSARRRRRHASRTAYGVACGAVVTSAAYRVRNRLQCIAAAQNQYGLGVSAATTATAGIFLGLVSKLTKDVSYGSKATATAAAPNFNGHARSAGWNRNGA